MQVSQDHGPSLPEAVAPLAKPLMRGWSHALAAAGSVVVTAILLIRNVHDLPGFISILVFGLSMVVLYTVSAVYHIPTWQGRRRAILRALDHANIFILIAGTYTPIAVKVLSGGLRAGILIAVWTMAIVGAVGAVFTLRLPRWASTALYVVMGWVSLIPAPTVAARLPRRATALLASGGVLYTIGAVTYAARRPNPFPRVFGYHEIFHLFVISGSVSFLIAIWRWVIPFRRS